MKKMFLISGLLLCGLQAYSQQDPGVNIQPDDASITKNSTTLLRASTGNWGNGNIPVNALQLTITVGSSVQIMGVDASSDPRWTVQSLTTGAGNRIILTNTNGAFSAIDVEDVVVTLKGVAVGTNSALNGNIAYLPGAGLPNGQPLNDNSSSTLTVTSSLPVQLISFRAKKAGSTALLQWATATEQQTSHFDLVHSVDATHWTSLGTVKAVGNSTVLRNYELIDKEPAAGVNYYKLLTFDVNGAHEESIVCRLDFTGSDAVRFYPVPVRNRLNISGATVQAQINVYNSDGRKVISEAAAAGEPAVIDMGHLSPGIYHVTVTGTDGILLATTTITKQ